MFHKWHFGVAIFHLVGQEKNISEAALISSQPKATILAPSGGNYKLVSENLYLPLPHSSSVPFVFILYNDTHILSQIRHIHKLLRYTTLYWHRIYTFIYTNFISKSLFSASIELKLTQQVKVCLEEVSFPGGQVTALLHTSCIIQRFSRSKCLLTHPAQHTQLQQDHRRETRVRVSLKPRGRL